MRRRHVLGLLGSFGVTPFSTASALAQPLQKVPRVAVAVASGGADDRYWRAFFEELTKLGWAEGRNLQVERHSFEGQTHRFSDLAREVAQTHPDLIVTATSRMALAFKMATSTIPIVMSATDPVSGGLVTNLARPGGNITGVSADSGRAELMAKRFQIIKEVLPSAKRVGYLAPASVSGRLQEVEQASHRQGLELLGPPLGNPVQEPEYRRVLAAMVEAGADAVLVNEATENLVHGRLIIDLARQYRIPAHYSYREHIEGGGLMGLVVDYRPAFRQMAVDVDLILKGTSPGDIPIHLPVRLELLFNLKTAQAQGLTIPPHLIAAADEVIE